MHILTNVSLIYGIDLGFRWVITKKGPFITHATCVNKLPSRITQTQPFFLLFVCIGANQRLSPKTLWITRTRPRQLHIISKIQILLSVSKTHMFMASSRMFHHKTARSRSSELFLIRTPPFLLAVCLLHFAQPTVFSLVQLHFVMWNTLNFTKGRGLKKVSKLIKLILS